MPTTNGEIKDGDEEKKKSGGDRDKKTTAGNEYPLTGIKRPGEHDVLQGRGGLANNFCGNILYRATVESRKAEYVQSQRSNKTALSWHLVRWWRSLDPPGRFLKQDDAGLWHDIGDKKARRKTSQLFREDAKAVRAQIGCNAEHQGDGADDASEGTEDTTATNNPHPELELAKPTVKPTSTSEHHSRISSNKPSPQQTKGKGLPVRKNSTSKKQYQKVAYKPKGHVKPAPRYAATAAARKDTTTHLPEQTPETLAANITGGIETTQMPLLGEFDFPKEEEDGERKPPALAVESEDSKQEPWASPLDRLLDNEEFVLGDLGDLVFNTASGVPLEPLMDNLMNTSNTTQQPTIEDPMDVEFEEDDSGRQVKREAA
ncbi:expressed unknown protein [Seminavis robusta]|uniref:DUF6824 domain-containing protein n=1 Tax=Seminavis robusta TaxID=568900 RepID=A0A9N8E2M3_9STRA|nr:expressed unknown protein [Seminavis robusta]|eukprot:Sro591_g172070.1 n/a (373) ;mRNA; f:42822-44121